MISSLLKSYTCQSRELQQRTHEAAVLFLVAVMIAIGLKTHEEILVVIHCTNASSNVEREVALPIARLWLDIVTVTKIGG